LAQGKRRLEASISQLRSFPYGPFFQSFFTTRASYRSGRAHELLGWHPRVDRAAAMVETLAWVARAYPRDDAEAVFRQ
jgi:nucleoside-diphosphate-sugar epimerase